MNTVSSIELSPMQFSWLNLDIITNQLEVLRIELTPENPHLARKILTARNIEKIKLPSVE